MEISSISSVATVQKAVLAWVNRESLTIAQILRDQGAKHILTNTIATELSKFCDLISTAGNMTNERILRVAEKFLEDEKVPHLNVHELKYFLKNALSLKYGKVYHGFGYDIFMDWFASYWQERQQEFENFRQAEHIRNTGEEKRARDKGFIFGNAEPPSIKTILSEKDWERSGE